MTRRGSRLNIASVSTRGNRWLHWTNFIVAQTSGASTTLTAGADSANATTAVIGESAKTFGISGIGITTAKTLATFVGGLYDVDLTAPVTLTWFYYCKTGMSDSDAIAHATTIVKISTASGTADDVSTDNAVAVSSSGSLTLTTAANDTVSIRSVTDTISAANLASYTNSNGMLISMTPTLTGASANEFIFQGLQMTYTVRV